MTELQEQIIELRKQNVGMKAIAKMLNCTLWTVRHISKRHDLNGYRASYLLLEDEVKNRIEDMLLDFEYIGGWESVDKYVYLQCKWCGYTFKHSAQFLKRKHSHFIKCSSCSAIARQVEEEAVKREREKQRKIEQEERQKLKEQRLWQQKFSQIKMKTCKNCLQLFIPNGKRKMFCSDMCADYYNKAQLYERDKYRYRIPLERLYERDGGICHICNQLCDWNDCKYTETGLVVGLKYPTRDHVIPRSKGGLDTWENTKLAHLICNSLKSDKVDSPP